MNRQREEDADQDGVRPGVGSVIGARRVLSGVMEMRHPGDGSDGADDAEPGDRNASRGTELSQAEDQENRGEQIELFFDREAPQVANRRLRSLGIPVRVPLPDLEPVHHVRQR